MGKIIKFLLMRVSFRFVHSKLVSHSQNYEQNKNIDVEFSLFKIVWNSLNLMNLYAMCVE